MLAQELQGFKSIRVFGGLVRGYLLGLGQNPLVGQSHFLGPLIPERFNLALNLRELE
jgi:hypothetical protein